MVGDISMFYCFVGEAGIEPTNSEEGNLGGILSELPYSILQFDRPYSCLADRAKLHTLIYEQAFIFLFSTKVSGCFAPLSVVPMPNLDTVNIG